MNIDRPAGPVLPENIRHILAKAMGYEDERALYYWGTGGAAKRFDDTCAALAAEWPAQSPGSQIADLICENPTTGARSYHRRFADGTFESAAYKTEFTPFPQSALSEVRKAFKWVDECFSSGALDSSDLSKLRRAIEALAQSPGSGEAIRHLTAELVRMTTNACSQSREYIHEPIPIMLAEDANYALQALDKYGDQHEVERTTALSHVREDVKRSLAQPATPPLPSGEAQTSLGILIATLEGDGLITKVTTPEFLERCRKAQFAQPPSVKIGDGKDSQRLDWLEKEAHIRAVLLDVGHHRQQKHDTVRQAIDAAMQADAGREEK